MKSVVVFIFLVIIAGCSDSVIPSSDEISAKEISTFVGEGAVNVQLFVMKTVIINIKSNSFFKKKEIDRDEMAEKIALVVLKNNKETAFVTLMLLQERDHGQLMATYSWEVLNGELIPIKQSS